MNIIIIPLIAFVSTDDHPKTFEDLEIAKIVAMHEVKNLRMETTISLPSPDGPAHEIHLKMLVLGDRRRCSVIADDQVQLEVIDNSPTSWIIVPPQRKYAEIKPDTTKEPKFDPKEQLLKAEPDSFSFKFDSDEPVRFAPYSAFVLQPMEVVHEGSNTLRKVAASITSKKTGNKITVTQWFLPDKWFLKRFTIEGRGQDGPISLKGEASVLDFKSALRDSDFILDMTTVQGFDKVDNTQIGGDSRT